MKPIMNHPTRLLCAAAALLLSACHSLPVYEPTASDASIAFIGMGRPAFCTASGRYGLDVVAADGYRSAKVPAGQRLTLWTGMTFDGYQVISRCSPALAFTPAAGGSYIVNAGLSSGQCFIELVREDKSRDTGVALEASVGKPEC